MKCLERTCIANIYNELRAYVSAIKGFYNECSCTKRGGIYKKRYITVYSHIRWSFCELEIWLQGTVRSSYKPYYITNRSELPLSVQLIYRLQCMSTLFISIRFSFYFFRYFMYSSVECGKILLRPLCSYLKAIFSFQMRCIPSAIN